MSNYHYYERNGNTANCDNSGNYRDLKSTTHYSCDQPCLCRFSNERSDKDKLYYDWFVLNQPMVLPPKGNIPPPPKNNCS